MENNVFSNNELFKKFEKFQSRSKAHFTELFDRIEKERAFLAGNQWTKEDDKLFPKTRTRITINVLSNSINSIANQYAAWPMTWFTGDAKIDKEIDEFFKIDSNRFAVDESLRDCVAHGLGVLALGTEPDGKGNEKPIIYTVSDFDRIMLDGDSTELDGSDAMEGALVDYRSREWIRVHLGEEFLPAEDAKMVVSSASCHDLVPIITYYWLDTDGCHMATFVNDRQQGDEFLISSLHRIPIFPIWGEVMWKDKKKTYCGLCSKGEPVAKVVNYAFTQLVERLALSPKPKWKGYLESFKDLDQYYKRAANSDNPIIPGQRLANDNKTQLPLPERVDNTVQFADVQGIMEGTMGMLSSITGVDSRGLADVENEVTATAVMYTSKVFQNNVRHYFQHLKTSFKSLGDCVMQMLGHTGVMVDVTQGPDDYAQLQVARQELTALMAVAEPNQKRALINAILRTHPDNEVLADLYAQLNAMPAPTPMEEEAMRTVEQMKVAIEGKDQQILQLTAQIETMQRQMESQDKSYMFDLKKMELEHRYKQEDAILNAQLNSGADADKARAEVEKAQLGVEKEVVALQREEEKANLQHAENVTKLVNGMFGEM